MSEKFKYDIFLSHSSKDKPIIRDLAKRLKRDGLRIWFDEWEIKPGDVIPLKIQQGLEQSRTLVLAMSTNAFTSEWVTLERNTVLFRDPNNTDRRFIPIRLDESKIPDTLRQFAYIPWQQPLDDHYINLLTACRPNAVKRKRNRFSSDVLEIGGESVVCIAITVDGQRAIAGLEDGTVKVWDLASRRCVAVLQGHSYQVESVAVTANGQRVLSGSEDGTLRIWDIQSKKCVSILDYSDWVTAVAVTADGQRAISGSDDGTIQIWNLNSKKCITTLEGHLGRVTTVAVTADGRRIISSSTNGSVRIWEIESNKCLAVVKYPNWVTTMAVTADGRRVISGSDNGTVRIWDIESKDYIAILEGHTDTVTTVAVTADGRRVISGSTDKTVRVWDIDSKSCVATLKGHSDAILVVAMKADGRRAISASRDGRLLIWNLPALAKQLDKDSDATRYTNAKVVLVGETGVGKTGLALRLCEDRWEPTEST
ncbi:MAG: TIR domain-containing protein, partial [Candidatus Manganitrophaceae bacterium]